MKENKKGGQNGKSYERDAGESVVYVILMFTPTILMVLITWLVSILHRHVLSFR
jgi:hypothetical protein